MINSSNTPLDKKKVYKKTISSSLLLVGPIMPISIFALGFSLTINTDISNLINLLSILAIIFSILILLLIYIYQYYYYKLYFYRFEEKSATIRKGVISKQTGNVNYDKIQNIYVDQDILDRIFGLFDVHYETAGTISNIYSHVDGLNKENADKLVAFLNQKVNNIEEKKTNSIDNQNIFQDKIISRENIIISDKIIGVRLFQEGIIFSILFIVSTIFMLFENRITLYLIVNSLLIIIGTVFLYIYLKIWYKNFDFKFSDQSGVIINKVINSEQTNIYYNKIQNVNISQSILERFFNLYAVSFETAATNGISRLYIYGLSSSDSEYIKNFLLFKSKNNNTL